MANIEFIVLSDLHAPVWTLPFGWRFQLASLPGFQMAVSSPLSPAQQQQLRHSVQQQWQSHKTAMAVHRTPPQALFFDFDATVVEEESIVELARHAGVMPAVEDITRRAMNGELDFANALRERVKLLQGLPADLMGDVTRGLTPSAGLLPLTQQAATLNIPYSIVSGGFDAIVAPIAQQYGYTAFLANHLNQENGRLSGTVTSPIVDAQAKARFIQDFKSRHHIPQECVVCIGDGANDIPMMAEGGWRLGHHPKPVLLPHLDGAIFNGDLRLIADLLRVAHA